MNITTVLAQVLGIMFTVLGLSIIFSTKGTITLVEEVIEHKSFLWLWGFIALIIGAVIVALNNLWNPGLDLFITLIGWAALIKGIFILVFPNSCVLLYRKLNKKGLFISAGFIALIIGLILLLQ